MDGRYLLDTNIIIGVIKGEIAMPQTNGAGTRVYLPVIAIGELYFGAAKSGRPDVNRSILETFIKRWSVLECDLGVAREYGRLKQDLKVRGMPLPENDLWIAAIALHHSLPLVTRDRHFSRIDGLTITRW